MVDSSKIRSVHKDNSSARALTVVSKGTFEDNNFKMSVLLELVCKPENLIPEHLPKLKGKVKYQSMMSNSSFVKSYTDLCIWKHMNHGIT